MSILTSLSKVFEGLLYDSDSDSDSDIYFQTTTEHVVTIMQKNRNVGRLGKRMAWIGRLPAQPVLHT